MNNNNNNDANVQVVDADSPTGEYPALDETLFLGGHAPPRLNGNDVQSCDSEDGGATFWLSYLEVEIARLHGKWAHVEAEFKGRGTRIAELQEELRGREAVADELSARLEDSAAALIERNQEIGRKEAEFAALTAAHEARGADIEQAGAAVAAAEERCRSLEQDLASARSEISLLRSALERERQTAAALHERIEALTAEGHGLREKVQDLETYIDGRQHAWDDLKSQVADHRDALAGLKKAMKAKDRDGERHERDRRTLAAQILNLEREAAELKGRRKEREAAYDELQKKLADHFELTERLKADLVRRAQETEHALAKAADDRRRAEELERTSARKDENIAEIEAELAQGRAAIRDLGGARDELSKRVADLEIAAEHGVEERVALREELRASNEQLSALRQLDSSREAELARSREAADENARLAKGLRDELAAAKRENAERAEELRRAGQRAAELDAVHSAALSESADLQSKLAAQRELVSNFEQELRAKHAALDVLQRNVQRISDLRASVAALDRRIGTEPATDRKRFGGALLEAADGGIAAEFAETIAGGDTPADAAPRAELLPSAVFLEDGRSYFDVGEPLEEADAGRPRLVATVGGQLVSYALGKSEMTIGRGRLSDIRIASHYVSRVHARITTRGIGIQIEDAGSKNGILVNAERVQRCILRDGDVVSLGGELDLRFVDARH